MGRKANRLATIFDGGSFRILGEILLDLDSLE